MKASQDKKAIDASQHLWKASCVVKAMAALFASISSAETQLTDEEWYRLSQILRQATDDIAEALNQKE